MFQNQRTRGRGRKVKWLAVCAVVVVGLVLWYVWYRQDLSRQVEEALQEIREAGYPVTLEELNEWYPEPLGENAAYIYLEAADAFVEADEGKYGLLPFFVSAKLPEAGEALPEAMKKQIVEFLAENAEALELLDEAAGIGESRYPLDFTLGDKLVLPAVQGLRIAAQLLYLETIFYAESGEDEEAVRSLVSGLAVGRSLSQEPLLISRMVEISCREVTLLGVRQVIERVELSEEQLKELARAVEGTENLEGMARAIAGNRCFVAELFVRPEQSLQHRRGGKKVSGVFMAAYRARGLLEKDYLTFLSIAEQQLEAAEARLERRLSLARATGRRIASVPKSRIVTRITMSSFRRVWEVDLAGIARLRACVAALGVARYRLAKGRLPDGLGELVGEYLESVPADPFTGQPLRYKKLQHGYVVYSVGKDEKDDGAVEEEGTEGPDIIFEIGK